MAKVRPPVVEELLQRSQIWHLGALVVLVYLLSPLVFCLLTSVADSTTIETPLSAGFSLRWYAELAGDPRWRAGLLNSLLVAGLTIPLALISGTGAAIAFERHDFPGRTVVGALVLAPLFVPPVTLGMQSLAFHQRVGLWGSLFSLALAHTLWATPVVFTLMRAVLASLDPRLEAAAQGLGATPLRAFLLITLPQIVPGLVTAAFLTFILSLNELVMTMFLATPRTQTLPTLIWPLVRSNVTPVVAAASGVTVLITIGLLVTASRLMDLRRALRGFGT